MGSTISFFDLFKFGMDNDEAGSKPLSIQGIGGLGMLGTTISLAFDVAGILLEPIKASWDEALDMAIAEELEIRKAEGLEGVRKFVRDYESKGYNLIAVSKETADKLVNGEFQTFLELEEFSRKDYEEIGNLNVEILYRETYNKNREENFKNYEYFFIKSSTNSAVFLFF